MKTYSENRELQAYYNSISGVNFLSFEEEANCVILAKKGDIKSRNKLLKANLQYVVSVAKKHQHKGLSLNDLIQEGNFGLLNSIKSFNPKKAGFRTHAVWWINQAITKAISDQRSDIYIPIRNLDRINSLSEYYGDDYKKIVSELTEDSTLKEGQAYNLLEIAKGNFISLEGGEVISSENKKFVLESNYKTPDEELEENFMKENINLLLRSLPRKEATIIEHRFGLNGKKVLGLRELGEIFGLTRSRIQQIEKKSIDRLKNNPYA